MAGKCRLGLSRGDRPWGYPFFVVGYDRCPVLTRGFKFMGNVVTCKKREAVLETRHHYAPKVNST